MRIIADMPGVHGYGRRSRTFHAVWPQLCIAALYYMGAHLGLALAFEETNASPVWPPSGIALAAVLLMGKRACPGILAGAFAANLQVFVGNGAGDVAVVAMASAAIGAGNALEAMIGALLINHLTGRAASMGERCVDRHGVRFRVEHIPALVGSIALACVVSSSIGSSTLWLAGIIPGQLFASVWFTWWLGDVAGVLILTPAIVSWYLGTGVRSEPSRSFEGIGIGLATVMFSTALFFGLLPARFLDSLPYLIMPLLMWSAFRLGLHATTIVIAIVSILAVAGTTGGTGPFAGATLNTSLLLVQMFVCVLALTGFTLSVAISERERALAEGAAKTDELTRSNEELGQFAYVVSHDLKAPLRAIITLAQWIAEDNAEILPEESRQNLDLLKSRTRRMNNLIVGILQYSRAGRGEVEMSAVDSNVLTRSIVEALCVPSGISIRVIEPLPTIHYDPVHFEQVMQNLVDNAVKHMHRDTGEIVISCEPSATAFEFSVRDDGPGIAPENFERIFRIFQTLKARDELEATGIGLTLVQRIVHRHGGEVRIESSPGVGSTFYFTVPAIISTRDTAPRTDSPKDRFPKDSYR